MKATSSSFSFFVNSIPGCRPPQGFPHSPSVIQDFLAEELDSLLIKRHTNNKVFLGTLKVQFSFRALNLDLQMKLHPLQQIHLKT